MATRDNGKRYWVGFDLGGTKMLAKVYDEHFNELGSKRKKTKAQGDAEAGLDRIGAVIRAALDEAKLEADQLAGIGIGCPGPLDLDAGVALDLPNVGWKNTPVKDALEDAFGCPAIVINDVDAGIYGEYRFGAARDSRCAVGVFPGTGIGGGCVYEGNIMRGQTGSCMEIGHIPVMDAGPWCGCGRRGCLETVASRLAVSAAAAAAAYRGEAPRLLEEAGTDLADIRSGALAASVAAGDAAVERILRDAGARIGWAMAGVVNLLAPDVVVIGGGLVEAMPELFREEVGRGLRRQVMPAYESAFEVRIAALGDDSSVIGAAAWAQHSMAG